jgi:acetoin utilization deacetylase AcuC-like enzyme
MLLYADPAMERHDPGAGHPERPDRLAAVCNALVGMPGTEVRAPVAATREQIARVHTADHIARVEAVRGRTASLDPDTHVSPQSVEAAYLAAGATAGAVDAVLRGDDRHAFALVRPPGHHAESHVAMGFCLFNNVAVAAEQALASGCERVLVVDWDVHHGNGTQESFYERDDVLFFSTHQFPFYPGTGDVAESGSGRGAGYTVNVPLPAGCDDHDYSAAFSDVLVPIADAFRPDLVLVSAGFDAHRRDPLAEMRATEEGYAMMAAVVRDIADRHARGRIVLTLEGGYDLDALAASARAVVDVLAGGATAPAIAPSAPHAGKVLGAVAGHHRGRWKL